MKRIFQILFALSIIHCPLSIIEAQEFQIANGFVQVNNSSLVLENADFVNNGTFSSTSGNVEMVGTTTNTIGGSTPTTFSTLTINKISGEVQLNQNKTVSDNLHFKSGLLDVQNSNLQLTSTATVTDADATKYVQTSGTGFFARYVDANDVHFPVGNSTYNPVILNNAGTADDYYIRVEDQVQATYAAGSTETQDVVNRAWRIDESISGGSDVSMTLQWNTSEELADFDRTKSGIAYWDGSLWNKVDTYTAATANGSTWTQTRTGITDFTTHFAIEDVDEALGSENRIQVKVFLQGPFASTNMDADLRDNNLVPMTDPYTGIKTANSLGTEIVDWVIVELRDPTDNTEILASQAGLLRSDGMVLDKSGASFLSFNNLGVTSAYIAVRHRNHLGVMSQSAVSFLPD